MRGTSFLPAGCRRRAHALVPAEATIADMRSCGQQPNARRQRSYEAVVQLRVLGHLHMRHAVAASRAAARCRAAEAALTDALRLAARATTSKGRLT